MYTNSILCKQSKIKSDQNGIESRDGRGPGNTRRPAIKSDQNGIERSLSHPQTGQRLISMIKSDQNGIERALKGDTMTNEVER